MSKEWLKALRKKIVSTSALVGDGTIKTNALQAFPFWIASFFTGIVAVAYTRLFGIAETALHKLIQWQHWTMFIVTPISFFLAWLIVQRFAPNAKGSGIPQVMAAIDLATPKYDHRLPKLLSIRIALTKIASSTMMVLGGGAVGREGPTIQIAGSIFSVVHKLIPKSWPRLSKQSFLLTGAAAGLAAAFNTPLGGIVFAVEELAKIHIRYFRTPLFTAVIIAGLTAQAILGPYLYLGYPNVSKLDTYIFLGVAGTAIAAGMLGSLMCRLTLRIMKWKKNFSKVKSLLFVLGAGLLLAAIAFFINDSVMGSGKDLINNVLFTSEKSASWYTVTLRIFGPILCFNTGAAGGIFAPSLAAGASVGALISDVFNVESANANLLILSGMVGFLTGVTRTPFTSAILVLEMTDRHSVIFHLMIAALLSNIAALMIDKHSFYEQLKKEYVEGIIAGDNTIKEQPSSSS